MKLLTNLVDRLIEGPRPSPPRGEAAARDARALALRSLPPDGTPRVAFVIDATGSRSPTWEAAQRVQARMFKQVDTFGKLHMRVTCFRGRDDIQASPWCADSASLVRFMRGIDCAVGGTQLVRSLGPHVLEQGLSALCVIGDACEEDQAELEGVARMLKRHGIRVFGFLEGDSREGRRAFQALAELTGGAFAPFGSETDLTELCTFVASFATRGEVAVRDALQASGASAEVHSIARQLALSYDKGV